MAAGREMKIGEKIEYTARSKYISRSGIVGFD